MVRKKEKPEKKKLGNLTDLAGYCHQCFILELSKSVKDCRNTSYVTVLDFTSEKEILTSGLCEGVTVAVLSLESLKSCRSCLQTPIYCWVKYFEKEIKTNLYCSNNIT